MDIFVNGDVLKNIMAKNKESDEKRRVFKMLFNSSRVHLWVSLHVILDIYRSVSDKSLPESDMDFLKSIRTKLSTLPILSSVIRGVQNKGMDSFEDSIQLASAEIFNMQYILTDHAYNYPATQIPVFSLTEFYNRWKTGEFDSSKKVPFLDLRAQRHQVYNKINDRINDIIGNTSFILGKYVEEFEDRFAKLQEVKYCIGVSSGTDALHIALMALDIGPGDTVIVPTNTFIATAEAVSMTGAKPIFIDCDAHYNLDIGNLEQYLLNVRDQGALLPKAIIPVHLYGQPANMRDIMEIAERFGLVVIEDCCQAHLSGIDGIKVGNWGAFGAFSFYPGKNLGAYGEAGALVTNDKDLFSKAQILRQHGEIKRYYHSVIGHNYRMSAIQGAVLGIKINFLREWTEKRYENAQHYNRLLRNVDGVAIPLALPKAKCVYHLYVIQVDNRDGLRNYLKDCGVDTGLHYPLPLHLQKAYAHLGYKKGDFPRAELAAKRILSLPMYPELTIEQIGYVCEKIIDFIAGQ